METLTARLVQVSRSAAHAPHAASAASAPAGATSCTPTGAPLAPVAPGTESLVDRRRLAGDRGDEEGLAGTQLLGEERAALGAERDRVLGGRALDRSPALEQRPKHVAQLVRVMLVLVRECPGGVEGHERVVGVGQQREALGEVELAHGRARGRQAPGGVLDRVPRVGVGAVPPRGARDREGRRAGVGASVRAGPRLLEHRAEQREVLALAREPPERVEVRAQPHHARQVDEAAGRLQPERAAERGGAHDGPRGLRAERGRDHPVGDGGRRPARRAARRAPRRGRVRGLRRLVERELGRDGLAEHDRARGAQPGDARRVVLRPPSGVDRAAALGGQARRVDDVLHADGHAVQWAARRLRVALARLGERGRRVEVRPGADRLVARGDPLEACGDERRRGQLTGGDAPGRLGRAEPPERLIGSRGRLAHAPLSP